MTQQAAFAAVTFSTFGSSTVIARSDSDEAIHGASLTLDCFADAVIGRAFARPVGSQ
jgi:hypothetical protein